MKTREITRLALLTAVAVVLGYIERLIPMPGGIPGIKLGLANTVLLYAIYLLDTKSAVILMVLKVGLSGLMYGGVSAMLFSLGGGALSLAMMLLVKKLGGAGISIVGVSVVGAMFHNVGQVAVAATFVQTAALMGYVPFLLVAAVITGVLTGIAGKYAIHGLEAAGQGKEKKAKPPEEPK
ncbi:MAG: Gx transporter family protein [Pseudoflavonifractor sp.]